MSQFSVLMVDNIPDLHAVWHEEHGPVLPALHLRAEPRRSREWPSQASLFDIDEPEPVHR